MKRHPLADSAWSPSERKLLEEGIIPSPHSLELARTTQSDFLDRLAGRFHVAELYHENSKYSAASMTQPPDDPRKLTEARDWFFATAYDIQDTDYDSRESHQFRADLNDLPASLRSLLEPFTRKGPQADLLFSVDLLVLCDGRLLRTVVWKPFLWLERHAAPAEVEAMAGNILDLSDYEIAQAEGLVFLVGCPWRYMMLYGPRGYRHTMMECGRLLGLLEERARQAEIRLSVAQNFYDSPIDRFLYADGVERSTLAVLAVKGERR